MLLTIILNGCKDLEVGAIRPIFPELTYEGRWNITEVQFIQSQTSDELADTLLFKEEDQLLGTFFFNPDSSGTFTSHLEILCGEQQFNWQVRSNTLFFMLPNNLFDISAKVEETDIPRTILLTMNACSQGRGQNQQATYIIELHQPGGGGNSVDIWNQ